MARRYRDHAGWDRGVRGVVRLPLVGGGSADAMTENNIDPRIFTDDDYAYEKIREFVISSQRASTSLIQRTFEIGYNRAARMMGRLETAKVVTEPNEVGRRSVLLPAVTP